MYFRGQRLLPCSPNHNNFSTMFYHLRYMFHIQLFIGLPPSIDFPSEPNILNAASEKSRCRKMLLLSKELLWLMNGFLRETRLWKPCLRKMWTLVLRSFPRKADEVSHFLCRQFGISPNFSNDASLVTLIKYFISSISAIVLYSILLQKPFYYVLDFRQWNIYHFCFLLKIGVCACV